MNGGKSLTKGQRHERLLMNASKALFLILRDLGLQAALTDKAALGLYENVKGLKEIKVVVKNDGRLTVQGLCGAVVSRGGGRFKGSYKGNRIQYSSSDPELQGQVRKIIFILSGGRCPTILEDFSQLVYIKGLPVLPAYAILLEQMIAISRSPVKKKMEKGVARFISKNLLACARTPLWQRSPLWQSPEILRQITRHIQRLPAAEPQWTACGIDLSPTLGLPRLQGAVGEDEDDDEDDNEDDNDEDGRSESDALVEESLNEPLVDCDQPPFQQFEWAVTSLPLDDHQPFSSSLPNPPQNNTVPLINPIQATCSVPSESRPHTGAANHGQQAPVPPLNTVSLIEPLQAIPTANPPRPRTSGAMPPEHLSYTTGVDHGHQAPISYPFAPTQPICNTNLDLETMTFFSKIVVNALQDYHLECAIFGSTACQLYGTTQRLQGELDVLVLPPASFPHDSEWIKYQIAMRYQRLFQLIPAFQPPDRAYYLLLWSVDCYGDARAYPWPKVVYRNTCKVNIFLPGTMHLPRLTSKDILWIEELPMVPFLTLLLQTLRVWSDHLESLEPHEFKKHIVDAQDIAGLLSLSHDLPLTVSRPWRERKLMTNEYQVASASRVKKFCRMFPGTKETWRMLGFDVE